MQPYYGRIAAAMVLSVLLCEGAHSQTAYSSRHGLAYTDAGGFTEKSDRWIAKHRAKQERRFGPAIAAQFEQNQLNLRVFSDWLDTIWDEAYNEFAQCHDMHNISPSQVHISIEAEPFTVEGYSPNTLAAGVAYHDGRIQIVYWNVRRDIGGQAAIDLYKGELRNLFQWWLAGKPEEMWGRPACQ